MRPASMVPVLLATMLIASVTAQTLSSLASYGGVENDYGRGVAVDGAGNSYIVGQFFSDSISVQTVPVATILFRVGTNSIFVIKRDAQGMPIWAKRFGGQGITIGPILSALPPTLDIAVDALGNSYITGSFTGNTGSSLIVGPFALGALTGASAGFVFKLDPTGTHVWAKRFVQSGVNCRLRGITVDANAVYVAGSFTGGPFTVDTGVDVTNLNSAGSEDILAIKLDTSGNTQWATSMGGYGTDFAQAIAVDQNGNSYVTGFSDSPGLGLFPLPTDPLPNVPIVGDANAFIIQLSPAGVPLWARKLGFQVAGGGSMSIGEGIAVDTSNNIYVVGSFRSGVLSLVVDSGLTLTSSGGGDAYVVKFEGSTGTPLWAERFGGGADEEGKGIALDALGNIYITGYFVSASFPVANNPSLTNLGGQDVFLLKLGPSGAPLLGVSYGGLGSESGVSVAASPGASGLIHLLGNFASTTLTVSGNTLTNADPSGPFSTQDVFAVTVHPVTLTLASVLAEIGTVKEDLTTAVNLAGEGIKNHVTAGVNFASSDIKSFIASEIKGAEERIIKKIQGGASSGPVPGLCPNYPPTSTPSLTLAASTTSFIKLGRTLVPIGLQIAASDPDCPSSSKFQIRLSVFSDEGYTPTVKSTNWRNTFAQVMEERNSQRVLTGYEVYLQPNAFKIDCGEREVVCTAQARNGKVSRHYAIVATITNVAGVSKTSTLDVSVIASGRRRRVLLQEKARRRLHLNDTPDPEMRFLLVEAQGTLGA